MAGIRTSDGGVGTENRPENFAVMPARLTSIFLAAISCLVAGCSGEPRIRPFCRSLRPGMSEVDAVTRAGASGLEMTVSQGGFNLQEKTGMFRTEFCTVKFSDGLVRSAVHSFD